MVKTLGEYLKSLGIFGWLLMGLNLFTALGAFEFYTGIYVLQNFPTWGWLFFLIIGLLLAPFLAFRKVRKERDEARGNADSIIKELEATTILLNSENVSIARIFWGLSDFLTGAYAGGGLRADVFPQLLMDRFQEKDPKVWTNTQTQLISTLRMKKLIDTTARPARFGTVVYWVTTNSGLEVLYRLKAKGWPEPKVV